MPSPKPTLFTPLAGALISGFVIALFGLLGILHSARQGPDPDRALIAPLYIGAALVAGFATAASLFACRVIRRRAMHPAFALPPVLLLTTGALIAAVAWRNVLFPEWLQHATPTGAERIHIWRPHPPVAEFGPAFLCLVLSFISVIPQFFQRGSRAPRAPNMPLQPTVTCLPLARVRATAGPRQRLNAGR